MAESGEDPYDLAVSHYLRQKQILVFSSIVFTLALVISVVFSILFGIALVLSYLGGIVVCHTLFINATPSPNILFMLKRRTRIVSRSEVPRSCTICGDSKCRRHKSDLNLYNLQPWAEIRIPQEVDEALEEFLNTTLDKCVYSWYRDITEDDSFVYELRLCLRFMIAVLLRRTMKVDITTLITEKLLKAGIQHLDCYFHARRKAGSSKKNLEEAVLEYYGSNLHVAMYNRKNETRYLRQLCENVLPFLLPKKYLGCKSLHSLVREVLSCSILFPVMDVVADPDIVNRLLLLFFDKTPMVRYRDNTTPWVEVLANFVESQNPRTKSTLHMELSPMLNDQTLLYPVMQFLKEEAAVNVLQFYLAVEDFNRQMLDPDLTADQVVDLHQEAKHLYESYCANDALDRVQLDKNIVEEIRKIVEGPPENVTKLRTTAPLFQAYEQAYNLLDKTFWPLFHQSDDYFNLLCGARLADENSRGSGRGQRKGDSAATRFGSRINKIKGVFRPATVDGKLFQDSADIADAAFADGGKCEDSDSSCGDDSGLRPRDMSAWRVSIPSVDSRMEDGWKPYHIYLIEVQRIDVKSHDDPEALHWKVGRRYHEFYVLEARLIEFHGELGEAHLPSKKSFTSKGHDFMEARRKIFEEFLQKLLSKPNLRGSELLFSFLHPGAEFSTTMLPDLNLGKMIKTMPMKLLKEKGQHLEPFLQAFVQSTEAAKPRPSRLECRDVSYLPPSEFSMELKQTIFKNNAGKGQEDRPVDPGRPRSEIILDGIYDYLLYLAIKVFEICSWQLQFLMSIRATFKNSVEAFFTWYIDLKLEQALVPQRIVQLVHLLKDAVFGEKSHPPTVLEKARRADDALASFREVIPSLLVRCIGVDQFTEGSLVLFTLLQYPRLNKQLSYALLDILVTELFPELHLHHRSSWSMSPDH